MFDLRPNQDPKALWKRYGFALFIILAFLTASHVLESQAIHKAKLHAQVINLSGTQRVLSQQIILQAQTVVETYDAEALEQLSTSIDTFEQAHQTLMADAAREVSLGRLYLSRTPSTDEIVSNYIAIARAIPTTPYPGALLDELKTKGAGEVHDRLDEAVSAFEQRVQKQALWASRLQEITLLIATLVVIFEALFIFLPAHNMVLRTLRELRGAAETDSLTKLRNRAGFDADILAAMEDKDGHPNPVTLILFDLDDFKGINDRYGHVTGDAVLKRIGHRVARLEAVMSAARVGGDEFAVLVAGDQWQAEAAKNEIEADVRAAMEVVYRPINYQGRVINVSGSVGLSRYPKDADNFADLRRNASTSLLDAKRKGRGGLTVYSARINQEVRRRRSILSALLSREYEQDLTVVFQPIVAPKTGKIKSVEALARWSHKELGPLNPIEFLTIARECGLAEEIERRLRAMALSYMSPALRQGHIETLSLNVSPVDLAAAGFADALIAEVARYAVRPDQVWVEVTESERLASLAIATENLNLLSEAGFKIALDDYGVGYSNIQRLAELPIQRVKIDKSIVQNITTNPKYAGVFRSSAQLAKALGAEALAEGVETVDQLEAIERFGCKLVQGYYFYKPMSAAACFEIFEGRKASAA
ncbi:MAG: EAL domain-containing protein [Pseudomonadota bacterium]